MRSRHGVAFSLLAVLGVASCGGSDGMGPGGDDDPAARPFSVRIDPLQATLTYIGETVALKGTALSSAGLELTTEVTWTSAQPEVATVDGNGTVTAVSNGSTTIAARAGSVAAVATILVRQVAVSLEPVSGDGQSGEAGAPLGEPLVVLAKDQGGAPVQGASVTWTPDAGSGSAAPSLVGTSATGTAATTWTLGDTQEDQAIVAAVAGAPAVTFTATAVLPEPGQLKVTGVQPTVMIEGQTATITGQGFGTSASQNAVTIDGRAATVTAASATSLTVTVPSYDCRPPRSVTVTVERAGESASASSSVTPAALLSMAVGEGTVVRSSRPCLQLAAGGLGREYLIGALSVSEVASGLTAAQLFSVGGSSLVTQAAAVGVVGVDAAPDGASALRVAPRGGGVLRGPVASSRSSSGFAPPTDAWWREGEASVRAAEAALLERLGGVAAARAALARPGGIGGGAQGVAAQVVPNVGDTLTMFGRYGCSGRPTVRAVVRLVGQKTVWLDDVENPGPAFTSTELQELDAVYVDAIDATLTDYYGTDGDVDGNDRVVVLMTKTVNEDENLAGYVWSGDLFPTTSCTQSNHAEIFYGYVPDPDGVVGQTRTKASILAAYPSLIAHEVAHVRQMAQVFFSNAVSKSTWETEGGATLAEQLTGFRLRSEGPGQNLGHAQWQAGGGWYADWVNDLARYQGYVNATTRTTGAPEQCTWIARPEEGNTGPCAGGVRAPYGVPSTILRWILDEWGPGYPGGEKALMRKLTSSTRRGYANLAGETGVPIESVLAGFGAVLWMDGQGFDPFDSWNVWGIFGNVNANARLQPYQSTLAEPSMSVQVRGGSTAFLRWLPVTAHGPTSLRLRSPEDGDLPPTMVLWIVRLK